MIIGWSLVNSCIQNSVYEFSKAKVEFFKTEKLIPENAEVGLALQWCVDENFQGMGLIQNIYSAFEYHVKDKYEYIEASVRKNNPAGNAATTKLRMQTIYEDDLRFYKIKKIDKLIKPTPSLFDLNKQSINIRLAKKGDEQQLFELNKRWIIDGTDTNKGFLTSLYQPNEFRQIIECNEIIIAETN